MKLIIHTNLHKKFKSKIMKELADKTLIIEDVERFEVTEN